MYRKVLTLLIAMLLGGNAMAVIKNPMLWADCPDPDVIRVGDTFYLVSTTMHLMPGAPVTQVRPAGGCCLWSWTVGYLVEIS